MERRINPLRNEKSNLYFIKKSEYEHQYTRRVRYEK
jgi:hypothetical protein